MKKHETHENKHEKNMKSMGKAWVVLR